MDNFWDIADEIRSIVVDRLEGSLYLDVYEGSKREDLIAVAALAIAAIQRIDSLE